MSIIFGTVPKIRTKIKTRLLMPSVSSISACGYIDLYWLGFRFHVNWFIFIFNIKSSLLWGALVHQYHFHFFGDRLLFAGCSPLQFVHLDLITVHSLDSCCWPRLTQMFCLLEFDCIWPNC